MKPATFLLALAALGSHVFAEFDKLGWEDRILHDIQEAITCAGCEV